MSSCKLGFAAVMAALLMASGSALACADSKSSSQQDASASGNKVATASTQRR